MFCPKCGRQAGQVDHVVTDEKEVYRERYCHSCKHKFYTIEFEVENNSQFIKEWRKHKKKLAKITPVKDYGIR